MGDEAVTEPAGSWGGSGQTAQEAIPRGGQQQASTGRGGFDTPKRGKGLRPLLVGVIVAGLAGAAFYVFDSSADKVEVGDCLRLPDSIAGFRNAEKVACDDSPTAVKVVAKVDTSSGGPCDGVSSETSNATLLGIYREADDAGLCLVVPR